MVTGGTIFSSKCTKKRLAAGLRPDPLGELKRSPRPLSRNKGVLLLRTGEGSGRERGVRERRKIRKGRERREGNGNMGKKGGGREEEGRKGAFTLFLFYESTTATSTVEIELMRSDA